ncbi:MAG: CU044_5270 family protein [Actinobacteria bacterium]|nr:CU044_5270 family protein [Actinomycetota bacterium]
MNQTTDNLISQLRALDPARAENLDRPLWDAAADELLASILAADPSAPPPVAAPTSGGRRRWWTSKRVLAPAAVAATVAAVLAIGLPGGGEGGGAVVALDRVASAAAAQPPVADQLPFGYLRTESTFMDTSFAKHRSWSVYQPEIREEWSAADGSGRVRILEGAPRFVGPGDRAAWEAAGRLKFLTHGFAAHSEEQAVPAGTFPDVSGLPVDAGALAAALRAEAEKSGGGGPLAARMLELIANDLENPGASPDLRKALYEAVAQIPGIEYLGDATDQTGRKGVAVGVRSSYSGGATLYSLIYDPGTSEVLATEKTALGEVSYADGGSRPVLAWTAYLSSGRVRSLSSTP